MRQHSKANHYPEAFEGANEFRSLSAADKICSAQFVSPRSHSYLTRHCTSAKGLPMYLKYRRTNSAMADAIAAVRY
jgi:hypothetical protein